LARFGLVCGGGRVFGRGGGFSWLKWSVLNRRKKDNKKSGLCRLAFSVFVFLVVALCFLVASCRFVKFYLLLLLPVALVKP